MPPFPALIWALNTSGDRAAEVAIQKIKMRGEKLLPDLIEAASQTDYPHVRKWSLEALGEFDSVKARNILKRALNQEQPMTVKLHALRGIARTGRRFALKDISALLKDESGGIRVNALQTLSRIDAKSELNQVKKCLQDPKSYVAREAQKICALWSSSN